MVAEELAPITLEYALACSAKDAFETYTGRIGEWWDPRYTANADTLETVVIERHVGGRVYASHTDIGEDDWGEVTVWETGRRLVHTFTLAQDPADPSEVDVEFTPADGSSCTMRLAHGGWTEANVHDRPKFGDWGVILERFVALARV